MRGFARRGWSWCWSTATGDPSWPSSMRERLRDGRPWLLFRPVGRQIWVGPLFRPGVTALLGMPGPAAAGQFAGRHLSREPTGWPARRGRRRYRRDAGHARRSPGGWPPTPSRPGSSGVSCRTWRGRSRRSTRPRGRPSRTRWSGCRSARPAARRGGGEPARSGRSSWSAGPRTVTATAGIGRSPPEVTIAPLRPSRQPDHRRRDDARAGRAGRRRRGRGRRCTSTSPGSNLARRHRSLAHLRGDLRNMSSGKGTTDVQARASGLCEGLERYSGVYPGRRAATPGDRPRELGGAAVPLDDCLLFSERQYRERDAWNAAEVALQLRPGAVRPGRRDRLDAGLVADPAGAALPAHGFLLLTTYPSPTASRSASATPTAARPGTRWRRPSCRGSSSWSSATPSPCGGTTASGGPAVDLDSFADPYLERIRDLLASHGREMWVLDLTSDLGIPVFAAIAARDRRARGTDHAGLRRRPRSPRRPAAGRHRDEPDAVQPARSGRRRNGPRAASRIPETLHWLRTATVANQPYLLPDADESPRTASSYSQLAGPTTWPRTCGAARRLVERRAWR